MVIPPKMIPQCFQRYYSGKANVTGKSFGCVPKEFAAEYTTKSIINYNDINIEERETDEMEHFSKSRQNNVKIILFPKTIT